jgi:hypothetical protein
MTGPASSEVTTQNGTFNTIISVAALLAIIVLIFFIARGRTGPTPSQDMTAKDSDTVSLQQQPNF